MALIRLANDVVAQVDEEDVEKLNGYRWIVNGHGYVIAYALIAGKKTTISLHRLVTGAKEGVLVDHINHDTLDNRKQNLRLCSHAENMRNRIMHKNNVLGLKGVYVAVEYGRLRYRAQIRHAGKKICIGSFSDPVDAHKAYLHAAKKYHGEFANTKD